MNAVLLAAGYGTRLYPLTRHRAKPLLPVGGRPIIDYLAEELARCDVVERFVLVSNDRFMQDFEAWSAARHFGKPITLLNDGSTCNEDRRGAVADLHFAITRAALAGQPAYVLATDNLPRFDLTEIVGLHQRTGCCAVFACPVDDPQDLKSRGVAEVGEDGRVVSFEEKPQEPRGDLRVPPFYVYTAEAMDAVGRFIDEGNNPDAPGHFLAWLVDRQPVYALRRDEGTYDIGTLESYRQVCQQFPRA